MDVVSMADRPPILWMPEKFAAALPVVKAVEAVVEWDNEARRFTDRQVESDGVPVWRVSALIGTGWGGDLTPVEVRIKSQTKPDIAPDPSRIVQFLGMNTAATAKGGTA